MPSYKLTYFDIQGRGELIRWIFAVAKKPYTDERIKFEDWPKRKASKYVMFLWETNKAK